MAGCRVADPAAGPADQRMGPYLEGRHHPHKALPPRAGYLATAGGEVIAYVAGHLTRRFGCEGELQYLFVASPYRRRGVARELVRRLAEWFLQHEAARICVNVDPKSAGARPFYLSLGATDLRPGWMQWHDVARVLDRR